MRKNEAFPREMGENRKDQEKMGKCGHCTLRDRNVTMNMHFRVVTFLGNLCLCCHCLTVLFVDIIFYMSPLILDSYYADVSRFFFNQNDPVGFLWLPFLFTSNRRSAPLNWQKPEVVCVFIWGLFLIHI